MSETEGSSDWWDKYFGMYDPSATPSPFSAAPPAFCRSCGSPLLTDIVRTGYNSTTGAAIWAKGSFCPVAYTYQFTHPWLRWRKPKCEDTAVTMETGGTEYFYHIDRFAVWRPK